MGNYFHFGIWSSTKTRGVSMWFLLLGLTLSIVICSFLYLGFNINYSFCSRDHDLLKLRREVEENQLNKSEDLDHCYMQPEFLTEFHLLSCAARIGRLNRHKTKALWKKEPAPRVAFMFIAKGEIPHEPLWRRFFHGHEELYSLYTHNDRNFRYPNNSLFYGHQVPSQNVDRLSITLVDAMRRSLAYSILDQKHNGKNSWFVFLCESSIPIQSFTYTYNYLTRSQHSFVESFLPTSSYLHWKTEPEFHPKQMRKGELWMALELRHACMVLEDWRLYYKFKATCHSTWLCGPDEQYIQTLLAIKDAHGIANRTIMYVDWTHIHTSSPFTYNAEDLTPEWFQDIQTRVVDKDGMYHDTSHIARETNVITKGCFHNGESDSPCFLFARKVASSATKYLETLPIEVLRY